MFALYGAQLAGCWVDVGWIQERSEQSTIAIEQPTIASQYVTTRREHATTHSEQFASHWQVPPTNCLARHPHSEPY
jgi:hypothetical protein